MKVFVAGASGVIGRRLVPMLVEAGHHVTGMTRSPKRAQQLRELGAEAAVCDVYDAQGLTDAVKAAAPDAVVHELTDLPAALNPRKAASEYEGNDRIRTEGTRNLVAAAVAAGAKRMVSQSIAFAYEIDGSELKREEDPLYDSAPFPWSRSVAALHTLEDATTKAEGIEGIVLRYGFFYGPGSAYDREGPMAHAVRKRRIPVVGEGGGVFSFIHVDDAAAATVAALDRGRPAGVYNVVDDHPAPSREWIPALAAAAGAKPPRRVPKWLARLVAGPVGVMLMTELRGASNARAKQELGWTPRYPDWHDGFREVLG